MNKERTIERVITAHKQLEGGGFEVRRPLPTQAVRDFQSGRMGEITRTAQVG